MAKITIAQLELQFAALTARVVALEAAAAVPSTVYQKRRTYAECQTPAEKAEYLRQFNRNKRKGKERERINAEAPGESPSVLALIDSMAEDLGVSRGAIVQRGGEFYHQGKLVQHHDESDCWYVD